MRELFLLLLLPVLTISQPQIRAGQFLSVSGGNLIYGGDKVYLSGTNAAWIEYGKDFGDNGWDKHGDQWKEELDLVAGAGGNLVRVWVHVEGFTSPQYDTDGYIVATDSANTLVPDLLAFLDECKQRNIFMGLVLFNGAYLTNQNTINLFWDESKLQTYLDKALKPMVEGLSEHPALAFWEVMNEAEGSFTPSERDGNPCFDLTHLENTRGVGGAMGPGWTGVNLPIRGVLTVHNWIADEIHQLDPKALVTTGSWSPLASTNLAGDDPVHKTGFNHYSPACLQEAGGRARGSMDIVQFHTYPWNGAWQTGGPWLGLTPDSYHVEGPILVGEFPCQAFEQNANGHDLPEGASTKDLVEYLYTREFAGGLSWALIPTGAEDDPAVVEDVLTGIQHLEGRTEHGNINVQIN